MSLIPSLFQPDYFSHFQASHFIKKITLPITPYTFLNQKVTKIREKIATTPNIILNPSELSDLKEAFLKCNNYFAGRVLKNLTQLPLEEVKKAIFSAFEDQNIDKVKTSLDCFLKELGEESLIHLSQISKERIEEAHKKFELMRDRALASVLKTKWTVVLKELYYETSYFCHHLISVFISASGLNEIGDEKRPRWRGEMDSSEAMSKLTVYSTLLAYPSVVFVSFLSITGSFALALMSTGIIVMASIIIIPIYLRKFKPCPHHCGGLDNLNKKILRKDTPPVFERADILDRIQNAFCSGKGVILTGESGAGKTSIAHSLASLIVSKKAKKGANFLNGAQMFECNAHQFRVRSELDNLNFHSLSQSFDDHAKSFVLFIDEIAELYGKDARIDSHVKSFLTFLDKFPNVLCATTTKEYDEFIKNDEALNRRLVHIELKPLEPKELESALFQFLHSTAPELILEENVLPYIIAKAAEFNPKTSQIDGGMSLLKGAIIKATHITFDTLEKEIFDLKIEVESLENHLLHSDQVNSAEEIREYQKKQTALKIAQEQLSKKQTALDRIKKIEAISLKVKANMFLLADKTSLHSKKWLVNHASHKLLTDFLVTKRKELGLPSGITKALIDEIVAGAKGQ